MFRVVLFFYGLNLTCYYQFQVIPSLSNQITESNGKLPDLFAYVYTEDVRQKEEQPKSLRGQIQKCNLTKSRLVGGVTLAEVLLISWFTSC